MNEFKQQFFERFTDEIDVENDYYDSQFERASPAKVWDWIESNFTPNSKVEELREKLAEWPDNLD